MEAWKIRNGKTNFAKKKEFFSIIFFLSKNDHGYFPFPVQFFANRWAVGCIQVQD